jgi:hypothetical protein
MKKRNKLLKDKLPQILVKLETQCMEENHFLQGYMMFRNQEAVKKDLKNMSYLLRKTLLK